MIGLFYCYVSFQLWFNFIFSMWTKIISKAEGKKIFFSQNIYLQKLNNFWFGLISMKRKALLSFALASVVKVIRRQMKCSLAKKKMRKKRSIVHTLVSIECSCWLKCGWHLYREINYWDFKQIRWEWCRNQSYIILHISIAHILFHLPLLSIY